MVLTIFCLKYLAFIAIDLQSHPILFARITRRLISGMTTGMVPGKACTRMSLSGTWHRGFLAESKVNSSFCPILPLPFLIASAASVTSPLDSARDRPACDRNEGVNDEGCN
jgi:hypothetical protein